MIYKSYLIEQDINKIDKNITLFYGENLGLINDFKTLIKTANKKNRIVRLLEEEILKNKNILFREVSNKSLFEEEKIIFIDQVSDKFFEIFVEVEKISENQKIYLFSGQLEKRSKLRNYFEKSNSCFTIPCYEDNEMTLKTIIHRKLKDFKGVTSQNVKIIIENCNLNRARLNNEIEKIKVFFSDKSLNAEKIEKLLNIKTSNSFDKLKDAALLGRREDANKLLSDTELDADKNIFYLNLINQRLGKLLEINNSNDNIEKAVSDIKPPIFWKDRQNVISQAKIWNKKKIELMMKTTYDIEIKAKSNSIINNQILIKKLLVDLCELANAS